MNQNMNVRKSTKKITVIGIFTGITAILVFTPLGMVPLPFISLTICQIPAILASMIYGPVVGALEGLVFGLLSLLRALIWRQGVLDPLFINPLVSVLPRVLMGFLTYYVYKGASKLNEYVGMVVGACAGSIINTVGCMGMLYLLYARELVANTDFAGTAEAFILLIISTSGLAEMIFCAIVIIPIFKALKKVFQL